jgi:hypothetical protein
MGSDQVKRAERSPVFPDELSITDVPVDELGERLLVGRHGRPLVETQTEGG